MADAIVKLLGHITQNNYVLTLLVSMFPLIELKGAIPIGEKLGLVLWQSAPLAYLGSTLVCIPVFFLLVPIFNLLKKIPFIKGLVEKVETVLRNKALKLSEKAGGEAEEKVRKIYMISLFVFVAVPFPVTGVWTGTAIAVFLGMRFRDAILPLALGNLVAGSIITLLTFFLADYVDYVILALMVIAIVMLIVFIVKVATAKGENAKDDESEPETPKKES